MRLFLFKNVILILTWNDHFMQYSCMHVQKVLFEFLMISKGIHK